MSFAGTRMTGGKCGCTPTFLDDFNRADAPDLGENWAGSTFHVEDHTAVADPEDGTGVVAGCNVPATTDSHRARAKFKIGVVYPPPGGNDFLRFKLWLAYEFGHSGLAGSVVAGDHLGDVAESECAILQLWSDDEGVLTELAGVDVGGFEFDVWHELTVCYEAAEYPDQRVLAAVLKMHDGRTFRLEANPSDALTLGRGCGFSTDGDPNAMLTLDVDDFAIYSGGEQCGCCPTCKATCTPGRDDFEREILGCCWRPVFTPGDDPDWPIDPPPAGHLEYSGYDLSLIDYRCTPQPAAVNWQADVWLPATGDTARLYLGRGVDDNDWAVEIEAAAAGQCGQMRLLRGLSGGSGADTLLYPLDLPILNLVPEAWHRVALCYNPVTLLLVASVAVDDGDTWWHHAREITLPEGTKWVGLGASQPGTLFDRVRLHQALDEDQAPDCACCTPTGCEEFSDAFAAAALGCPWYVAAGSVSQTGGNLELGANALVIARFSQGGVEDDDCSIDSTRTVLASFAAASYSDVIRVAVGWASSTHYLEAVLTLASDAIDTVKGTLALHAVQDGSDVILETSEVIGAGPGEYTLCVSADWGQQIFRAVLTGVASGEVDGAGTSSLTPEWPRWAGLGSGTLTGTVAFHGVSIGHHIYDAGCADCPPSLVECCLCIGGNARKFMRLDGFGFTGDPDTYPFCGAWEGTTLLTHAINCLGIGGSVCKPDGSTLGYDDSCIWQGPTVGTSIFLAHLGLLLLRDGAGNFWWLANYHISGLNRSPPTEDYYWLGYWKDGSEPLSITDCLEEIDGLRLDFACASQGVGSAVCPEIITGRPYFLLSSV